MNINDLGNDELLLIFERVPYAGLLYVRQVCKRWRTLTDWEPLWHKLHAVFCLYEKTHPFLKETNTYAYVCLKLAPIVGYLEFRANYNEFMELSSSFTGNLKKVLKLGLNGITISEDDFIEILRRFGNDLQALKLQKWRTTIVWNQGSSKQRLRNLPMLRSLEVDEFNPLMIEVRSSALPNLQELHLSRVREESFSKILENHQELRCLRHQLKKLTVRSRQDNLSSHFPNFLEYFYRLEYFQIASDGAGGVIRWTLGPNNIAKVEVQMLLCRSRPTLNTSEWRKDNYAFSLVQNMTMLFMRPVAGSSFSSFVDRFPNLKKLTLLENCFLETSEYGHRPVLRKGKLPTNRSSLENDLKVVYIIGCDCGCFDSYRESVITSFANVEVQNVDRKESEICVCTGREVERVEGCRMQEPRRFYFSEPSDDGESDEESD